MIQSVTGARKHGQAEVHAHKLAADLGLMPAGARKVKPRPGRPKSIVPALPASQRLQPVR